MHDTDTRACHCGETTVLLGGKLDTRSEPAVFHRSPEVGMCSEIVEGQPPIRRRRGAFAFRLHPSFTG